MRKRVPYICSLLLVLVLISAFSVAALGANGENIDPYDFSKPLSAYNTSVSSAELLSEYLGEELTEAEFSYLSAFGALTLSYNANVQTSHIQTHAEGGELSILAISYSYIAANGAEVVWTPLTVTYKGEAKPLLENNNYYTAAFTYTAGEEERYPSIDVAYRAEFSFSADSINSILNQAYNDAEYYADYIASAREEYERACAEYQNAQSLYETYLYDLSFYESQYALYIDYLDKKALHDELSLEYEGYLSDLRQYESDKYLYDKYLADMEVYRSELSSYLAYLEQLEEYNKLNSAYAAYLDKVETVNYQLSVMDAIKWSNCGRTVYNAITGSTVTRVLENKSLLTSSAIGVDGVVVDCADLATKNLRAHFDAYFALGTDAEKYAYYSTNYEALKNDFRNLLTALDELYANRKVRAALRDDMFGVDYDVKYCILVCQLASITNALWDSDVYSYYGKYTYGPTWKIEDKTVIETLTDGDIIEDISNGKPLEDGYPATEPSAPPAPDPVSEPEKPSTVREPVLPSPVSPPPAAPEEIPEPEKPEPVSPPGEPPVSYTPPDEVSALVEAYERGELSRRSETSEVYRYEVIQSITKRFFGVQEISVVYFDRDGTELYSTVVDRGGLPEYEGVLPTKADDVRAYYTFSHWVDFEGAIPDFNTGSESIVLYPTFSETIKSYEIGWNVDGVRYTSQSLYGTVPIAPITPTKADDALYEYTFAGWSTPPEPVIGAAEYTATFTGEYLVPLPSGKASVTVDGGVMKVDMRQSLASRLDISKLLLRSGYDSISILSDLGELTLPRAAVVEMRSKGVCELEIKCLGREYGDYSYELTARDAEGEAVAIEIKLPVKMIGSPKDEHRAVLYYLNADGTRSSVKCEFNADRVEFSLNVGREYTLTTEYAVEIVDTQYGALEASKTTARVGETVYITASAPIGMYVKEFYAVDGVKNPVEIVDGKYFVMPSGGISIGVICAYEEYTVSFVAYGKTVSSGTYRYGDEVTVPADPIRANDSSFSYRFIGWSEEIGPVYSDKVYTAVYEAEVLPKIEKPAGLQLSEGVKRLLIIGSCIAGAVLVALIALAVFVFVRVRRRRKNQQK